MADSGKRYTALFSYSNEIEGIRHAAVALSLDDAVYLTNFRKSLEEMWKVPLSHRVKLNVSFSEPSACVEYDPSSLKGWTVTCDTPECTLSEEDVDNSNAAALTQYDYPPRVMFDIAPSENAESSTLQFRLTGMSKLINFTLPLPMTPQVQEVDRKLYEQAMTQGFIKAALANLIFEGVTGSGKSLFQKLVLGLPVPEFSDSTPLAKSAVRSMSICQVAVEDGDEQVVWKVVTPADMVSIVAENAAAFKLEKALKLVRQEELKKVTKTQVKASIINEHKDDLQKETATSSSQSKEVATDAVPERVQEKANGSKQMNPDASSGQIIDILKPTVESQNMKCEQALRTLDFDGELIRKMKDATGKVMEVNFIYMLDSGGQPPFRELLPHVVQQASGIVLTQKLNERLDFTPTITYREKGVEDKGYLSPLTNEQILYQYFQAVQSHNSTVFVIGTHRDLEHECEEESRADKNKRLLEAFRPVLGNRIGLYATGDPDQLIFPVDNTSRGAEDLKTAGKFRGKVVDHCMRKKEEIPLPWFMLEQLLQQLAKEMKVTVLSKEECYMAARTLHMSEDMCEAAMKYLHNLNIIFYRPDIIENAVFCSAQVALDKLTEIVHCSHRMHTDTGKENIPSCMEGSEGLRFRDYAQVDPELLGKAFPSHYRESDDVFTASDFLRLSERLLIAGKLENELYFIPSVLPDLNLQKVAQHRVTATDHHPPITIYYPKMWLPVGVVPALVVYLINHWGWIPVSQGGKPVCMCHNCMQFELPDGEPGSVTLIDSIKFLEIHVKQSFPDSQVCPRIMEMMLSGLEAAHKSLHYDPPAAVEGMICPGKCGVKDGHYAKVDKKKGFWRCSENRTIGGKWPCSSSEAKGSSQPLYSHQVLDNQFPGVCFLGEPHEVAVQSEPVTLSAPGLGVTLKIPPNAVQSSDEPVNISLRACLPSTVFQYPKGCTPLSAVYHISSNSVLNKQNIELTIEHFANLETDRQANEMTFFWAESKEMGKYSFTPMEGGVFEAGGHKCTISTRLVPSFVSAGSIPSSQIRKRYAVLCSYSNNIEDVRHISVAISLDDAVFITNFRKALEEEWKLPISHRFISNVFFKESSAKVSYRQTNLKGWSLTSDTSFNILSLEDVDYPSTLDYPPRIIFNIEPSKNAKPSTLQLLLTGLNKHCDFQVSLPLAKTLEAAGYGHGTTAVLFATPTLPQLHSIWTPEERIDVIRRCAPWWKKIGVHLKLKANALDFIETSLAHGDSESCCERLFERWLGGAGVQPATWALLLEALEDSNLYSLAKAIKHTLTTQFYAKETGVAVELSSVPSLTLLTQIKTREGEKIEVIKAVAPRWKDVGCLLDFDAIGKTLQQIQADNGHEGVESCCRVMFQHWLEGNGVQPVTWATLLEILEDCFFTKLAERIKASLTYEFQYPTIQGAEIIAQTRVQITPGKQLTYHWEGHGFEVHVPAGAISSESGPVTLSIQASLSGDYQLPDDRVLVSGVYWLALQPPVKFAKKVTVAIQHCASVKDDKSLPFFATAMCTQKELPYTFKPLAGGSFPESEYASIEVSHFSAFSIVSQSKSEYAICSYYITKPSNIWELHITITPKEELLMEQVKKSYIIGDGAEQGPNVPLITFSEDQVSLDTPNESWEMDGWRLCPLNSPSIPKAAVDGCKGRTSISAFMIQLKMQQSTQFLEKKVTFVGVEPGGSCITITREPQLPERHHLPARVDGGSTSNLPTLSDAARPIIEPPTLPQLLRLGVLQEVGPYYSTFGILLLNDITGSRLAIMELECNSPERITRKILQEWLEGKGLMPVSWETLVKTLRDTGLNALADTIQKKRTTQ